MGKEKKKRKPGTAADLANKIKEKQQKLTEAIKTKERQTRKENH